MVFTLVVKERCIYTQYTLNATPSIANTKLIEFKGLCSCQEYISIRLYNIGLDVHNHHE